jgi:hypothetical protein
MRRFLLVAALVPAALAVGAASNLPPRSSVPPAPVPLLKDKNLADPDSQAVCRDRIEAVRDERGLPKLERDNAVPDEPLFIAAVDKRIGGCAVMVMRNNTSDIRPLPKFEDGPPRLTPLGQ